MFSSARIKIGLINRIGADTISVVIILTAMIGPRRSSLSSEPLERGLRECAKNSGPTCI